MILGITGGTGCGKTTLLELIRSCGGLVLDCDEIYHEQLEQNGQLLHALRERFPEAFEGDVLNRKALGRIVFADPSALEALNAITHCTVRREVLRQLENRPALAAIDAIALFESGLNAVCDITVAVTAPMEDRVIRLMRRDGISEDYARSRIAAQHDDSWFAERCGSVLVNDGNLDAFRKSCLTFLRQNGISPKI